MRKPISTNRAGLIVCSLLAIGALAAAAPEKEKDKDVIIVNLKNLTLIPEQVTITIGRSGRR